MAATLQASPRLRTSRLAASASWTPRPASLFLALRRELVRTGNAQEQAATLRKSPRTGSLNQATARGYARSGRCVGGNRGEVIGPRGPPSPRGDRSARSSTPRANDPTQPVIGFGVSRESPGAVPTANHPGDRVDDVRRTFWHPVARLSPPGTTATTRSSSSSSGDASTVMATKAFLHSSETLQRGVRRRGEDAYCKLFGADRIPGEVGSFLGDFRSQGHRPEVDDRGGGSGHG